VESDLCGGTLVPMLSPISVSSRMHQKALWRHLIPPVVAPLYEFQNALKRPVTTRYSACCRPSLGAPTCIKNPWLRYLSLPHLLPPFSVSFKLYPKPLWRHLSPPTVALLFELRTPSKTRSGSTLFPLLSPLSASSNMQQTALCRRLSPCGVAPLLGPETASKTFVAVP
jgi:hypothetical protein